MLNLSNVNAWYGGSQVLHDISLSVERGSRVAVLGRNGAGKTTLFKSVMNGGPTVRGQLTWRDRSIAGLQSFHIARLGLALVPEDRRIFNHITVAENIQFAEYALPSGAAPLDLDEILRRFPMLQPLAARLGGQLSGGQQQMLAIARAVAASPDLLLVDEPTEGLAPVIVEQLARDMRTVCEQRGVGLLLSEQNIWFARQCTQVLYILESGRIVFSGSWSEFDARATELQKHLVL